MQQAELEEDVRILVEQAWDHEVKWTHIEAWLGNFNGQLIATEEEKKYALLALTRFMYFGKRLVREMLLSLYRDHFKTVVMQRLRRNYGGTKDLILLNAAYKDELEATRFIGVGNPSESGAHLLYYFRQVNQLSKNLFSDIAGLVQPQHERTLSGTTIKFVPKSNTVRRYVFFDDLVGSGDQASKYLHPYIRDLRATNLGLDIRYLCLFATTQGIKRLNQPSLFNGNAHCLFELDETYKALQPGNRYFLGGPTWFNIETLRNLVLTYSNSFPHDPLGFGKCELMLGFSHNTPDNTLPFFWYNGSNPAWSPAFLRFDKQYQ